jgi:hypothetical protein
VGSPRVNASGICRTCGDHEDDLCASCRECAACTLAQDPTMGITCTACAVWREDPEGEESDDAPPVQCQGGRVYGAAATARIDWIAYEHRGSAEASGVPETWAEPLWLCDGCRAGMAEASDD